MIQIIEEVTEKKISPIRREETGNYISKIVLDIEKIQKRTGWQPKIEMNEGIRKTWEWIKNNNRC